jgi:Na+-transporting NADH:ubiquinone oxidoreductase subunit NqrB
MDPRVWQIATLASLLVFGIAELGFPVGATELAWVLGGALGAQWLAARAGLVPRFDPKSALISALSLAILLRASEPWLLGAAGAVAVASKYALRVGGKHVWNPSALAIAALVVGTGQAWLSPGQWGSTAWFAFAIAGIGGLVVFRAERGDVTWAFGAFWCALVLGRSAWIGEPIAVPLYRLQDGALLLFTFFMISDPRTTPDARAARIAFAALVAIVGFALKFGLQVHAGLVFALVLCAPVVPLLDRWLPGRRHAWPGRGIGRAEEGVLHDPDRPMPVAARARHRLAGA